MHPLQISLLREFHKFSGQLPDEDIAPVSPKCVAALLQQENIGLNIPPEGTIYQLLGIPWCPGHSPPDRTNPKNPLRLLKSPQNLLCPFQK